MTVRVDIERLVLDGLELDTRGAEVLRDAVAAELTRLFQQRDPAAAVGGAAVGKLTAPAVRFAPGASPAAMGSQIGRVVYGSIGE